MNFGEPKKFLVSIEWEAVSEEAAREAFKLLGFKQVEVEQIKTKRSMKQNRALHLYFTRLADELNDAGFDMKKTIKQAIDIPWSPLTVKDYLWRPVMQAMLKKDSTTELDTDEITKVWEVINRTIGERTGVHVPFPSMDILEENGY